MTGAGGGPLGPTPDEVGALARATTVLSGQTLSEDETAQAGRTEALRFLSIIMNGRPHELRTLAPGKNNRVNVQAGVYSDAASLVSAAFEFDGETNVYVTLNPVALEPVDIRRVGLGEAAKDGDVPEVRWLAIDIDRSKTEPDADPFSIVAEVIAYLCSIGFPEPAILGSSANGYWLLYRIAQANTAESDRLRSEFLHALHERWTNVDVSVANPARICRLFGTVNLKGNKRSVLLRPTTDDVEFAIVSDELIRKVASTYDHPVQKDTGVRGNLDPIFSALDARGIQVAFEKRLPRGLLYQLSDCPFYPEDTHRSAAALLRWDDGNVAFRCQGNRCMADDNRVLALFELLNLRPKIAEVQGRLKVIGADEIKTKHLQFTFDERLALYSLNLLMGDEKIGKGLFAVWMMTALTTGKLTGEPVTVLYVTVEERLTGVKARLIAAGADLSRVKFLEMGGLGLPSAVPQLGATMMDIGATWLFLDGINKHFDRGLKPTSAVDVDVACTPLGVMADELEITVVGTIHTNRSPGVEARDKMAHQIEFLRVARSMLTIGRNDDDDVNERTVAHSAGNDVDPAPSLKIRIDTVAVTDDEGETRDIGAVTIVGETDAVTEDLFSRQADQKAQAIEAKAAKGKAASCAAHILAVWEKAGRPSQMPAYEFAGFEDKYGNKMIVARARKQLHVEAVKVRDEDGTVVGWEWVFPASR